MSFRRTLAFCLLVVMLASSASAAVSASAPQQVDRLGQILAEMTPLEKVGQLFLVSFEGSDLSEDSALYDLITNWHVGAFVLRADHDNFTDVNTIESAYTLISGMQTLAWQKTQSLPDIALTSKLPTYVPLYIGIEEPGGGGESSQIISGLSPIPSQMALGATWSPILAEESGALLGRELAALGFNLYLGPTLTVAEDTSLGNVTFSGTDTYGGDPYWVGELGKAYVNGLHTGSNGQMSVVARDFPGLGGADRPYTEEVATVRKSLEQLKQLELAPYLALVSSQESSKRVDGIMVSHVRFQGFQGNIRATTRPVSFDSSALDQLLTLEPLDLWRNEGGLTISDNLGSRAVRLFFDSTGLTFDAVNIARMAFLAGNDMLYLNDFIGTGDASSYDTIKKTLTFFSQKYQEDQVFAQRVDAAVRRIISAKLDLYGDFDLDLVVPELSGLAALGTNQQVSFDVAREAVTLISPSSDYLNTIVPAPPSTYEYVIIFTDLREQRQCSGCQVSYPIGDKALQESLISLYGPLGSKQLLSSHLSSYSFTQLSQLLDRDTELADPYMGDNLKRATWVIFNLQDYDPALPESAALRRILSERFDLLLDKKVIVFAYDAPYYLGATEISKLTAYYGLFSTNQGTVDVAARILMQEAQASGSLPISLNAVAYDLLEVTAPDPDQVIPISLITPRDPQPSSTLSLESTPTAEETPMPLFRLGETVKIQAGVIRDKNQHLVPDGTVVQFTIRLAGEEAIIAQPEATTLDGLATIDYKIGREGIFEVSAISEPARTSGTLVLNTQGGLALVVLPTPTATLPPTPTLAATDAAEPAQPIALDTETKVNGSPSLEDWLLMLMVAAIGFGLAFLVGRYWWGTKLWGLRSGLCALLGALAAYLLLTLGISGLMALVEEGGTWFIFEVVLIGLVLGWIGALVWWLRRGAKTYALKRQ